MATVRAGASRPGIGSLDHSPHLLGGSGRASAIFWITAGVFFPSFASVTSRSLAAATCAGVTPMTRRLAISASGARIASPLKGTHLGRSLRICKPDRVTARHGTTRSASQAPNVVNLWTLTHNRDPGVTIGIGALTISQPLWSTRRDSQEAACAEPYWIRGPKRCDG